MANRADITPELCRQLLRYEPETGKLFWLPRSDDCGLAMPPASSGGWNAWNGRHAGKPALCCKFAGYLTGRIDNKLMQSHRVIWAIVHGYWPDMIDHIDGNRSNNLLSNLRSVSKAENNRNQQLHATNTSGRVGVFWSAGRRKWAAAIRVNGKQTSLGRFVTFEEAVAVRERAERELGFHPNHGRQARRARQSQ